MLNDHISSNDGLTRSSEGLTRGRPLQLPEALWQGLDDRQRSIYGLAQRILERMLAVERGSLAALPLESEIDDFADTALLASAVRLLGRFGLIRVEYEGERMRLGLLATPEEHIRVRHPNGRLGWVFVARPLRAPDVDPSQLN